MSTANLPRKYIAVADDHSLYRKGLVNLLDLLLPDYSVLIEAAHGEELLTELHLARKKRKLPSIILMDIQMPVLDGFETMRVLNKEFPHIPVLIISMVQSEEMIIKMLHAGVKGYLSKDIDPEELVNAIGSIIDNGFYYTDYVSGKLLHFNAADPLSTIKSGHHINDREWEFLKWACTDFSYKEISDKMSLSYKTVDGYRDSLFNKFNVKSRVGLVIYAIKEGLITINQDTMTYNHSKIP